MEYAASLCIYNAVTSYAPGGVDGGRATPTKLVQPCHMGIAKAGCSAGGNFYLAKNVLSFPQLDYQLPIEKAKCSGGGNFYLAKNIPSFAQPDYSICVENWNLHASVS